MDIQARSIQQSGFFQLMVMQAPQWLAKIPPERSSVTVPFEVYVENDDGTQYIVKCSFVGIRQNTGILKIMSQSVSVKKAVWRKRSP